MDAVLLFSGQGAQKVGMGKDLYDQYPVAKALIEQADKALGESLSAVMFEGPGEELTRTCNCQPALYVHGLACLAVLKELVPSLNPVAAAGLSLGEFTAHAAAGTYSFEEGLRLVQKRGAFMEEACNATKGTMAAMIGGTDENVIYSKMEEEVNYHLLYKALSRLSPREKTIIQLRFGIRTSDGQEKTQKEVADLLGISQSYISRLEKKIIGRLKKDIVRMEGA